MTTWMAVLLDIDTLLKVAFAEVQTLPEHLSAMKKAPPTPRDCAPVPVTMLPVTNVFCTPGVFSPDSELSAEGLTEDASTTRAFWHKLRSCTEGKQSKPTCKEQDSRCIANQGLP